MYVKLKQGSAVLPFCRSAVLPFCRSAVLPFCRSAVLNKTPFNRRKFSILALFAVIIISFSACDSPVDPPAGNQPAAVTISDISGVTKPAAEGTPVKIVTPTEQYTGTVEWTPAPVAGKFVLGVAYKATITLQAKEGYTFAGVDANFFDVAGAATVTNDADSGVVSAEFPAAVVEKVGKPVADPAGKTYAESLTVRLSTSTDGAEIHYTLNGDTPTKDSDVYSTEIAINEPGATLKAIAFKQSFTNSDMLEEIYIIDPLAVFYNVSFDSMGGSAVAPQDDVAKNTKVKKPADPTKEGYTFAAWYKEAELTNPWNFDVDTVQENTVLYAAYTMDVPLSSTVTIVPYLADKTGTIEAPADLPMKMNIRNESIWNTLLAEILASDDYVNLDLSECPMDGIEFGFPAANMEEGGKDRIVSIALPDTAVNIRNGNQELEYGAFKNYSALKSFSGAALTFIGGDAFNGCTSLAPTALPDGITHIGGDVFNGCTSLALTALPDGITNIDGYAFFGCTNLALTALPEELTWIGTGAFDGCTNLALTSLPEGLAYIGGGAFDGCTSIALTALPKELTEIKFQAFYGCTSITEITCPNLTPPTAESGIFRNCTNLTVIKVPAASLADYKAADGWIEYADIIVAIE